VEAADVDDGVMVFVLQYT